MSTNKFGDWEILGDVPESVYPAPATGRLVIALEPPVLDGNAELEGEAHQLPQCNHLALTWHNRDGVQVLHTTDGFLLMHGRKDATWLPDGWEMDVFPCGWTRDHFKYWFTYAIESARKKKRSDLSPDRNSVFDLSYAPPPRGLVMHAHLIVRHLGPPNPPVEPRGPMTRWGCLAELRDVRDYLLHSLGAECPPSLENKAGMGPHMAQTLSAMSLGQKGEPSRNYEAASTSRASAATGNKNTQVCSDIRTTNLSPGAKAIAAAYDLKKEGRPVSLQAACKRASVDRGNLRKRYPEAVETIRVISDPDRTLNRGVRDRRTGDIHTVDDDDE